MTLSVHLLHPPAPEALAGLRKALNAGIQLTFGPALPTPADYHILVAGRPSREHLTASPNLRALIVPWAGLPETTRELLRDMPHLAVHNLHHNAVPVAEMALALLLAAAKYIVPMDRALRNYDWRPRYRPNPSLLLTGKTALVLGYGAIGRRLASLCQAIGMNVIAVRRNAPPSLPGASIEIHPVEALPRLLPRANALLVCLPHTLQTSGLIGERELALLPPGAVLVNVGRGAIVDEAALYRALCERRLHAAGLDVWYQYPTDEASRVCTPPSTFAFHELDNVVLSPHRAGGSDETERLRMAHLAALLNAAARGEEMPNRVDLSAGY